jgi:hypothetical protein
LQSELVLAHLVVIACRKRFINQLPGDRSAEAHLDETAFFGGVDGLSALDHVAPDGNVLGFGRAKPLGDDYPKFAFGVNCRMKERRMKVVEKRLHGHITVQFTCCGGW